MFNVHLLVSTYVHASQSKLDKIRSTKLEVSELQSLNHHILNGWPQKKHDIHALTNHIQLLVKIAH